GIREFDELICRTPLPYVRAGIDDWQTSGHDFSKIFHHPKVASSVSRRHPDPQEHALDRALGNNRIAIAKPALEQVETVTIEMPIVNINRTVGTMLSNQVAIRYGHTGLPDDTITVKLNGTAGQSFAAFLAKGITFKLTGEGNDYVGKGLCGGRIVIKPPV